MKSRLRRQARQPTSVMEMEDATRSATLIALRAVNRAVDDPGDLDSFAVILRPVGSFAAADRAARQPFVIDLGHDEWCSMYAAGPNDGVPFVDGYGGYLRGHVGCSRYE